MCSIIALFVSASTHTSVSLALSQYKYASAMLSCGGIRHQFSQRANIEMSQYGTEFLSALPERMRVGDSDVPDIQFVEGGYLFLASDKNLDILYANYETQRAAGASVELLTPEQLQTRFPWIDTTGIHAATLGVKHEGWFDPWSFLVAMKKKCVALGVDVLDGDVTAFDRNETNAIERVHITPSAVSSDAPATIVTASKVVNAAGPWASKLLEACDIHDFPVKPRYVRVYEWR